MACPFQSKVPFKVVDKKDYYSESNALLLKAYPKVLGVV